MLGPAGSGRRCSRGRGGCDLGDPLALCRGILDTYLSLLEVLLRKEESSRSFSLCVSIIPNTVTVTHLDSFR
jgi:hypothetical protein